MSNKRVAKHYVADPKITVEKFNIDEINNKNLANHLLVLTQKDISYTVMMKLFGEFNGKSLCHSYDTLEVPAGAFKYKLLKNDKEVSNTSKFITTIGIWIFNVFFIRDFGFSDLFGGYINKNINKKEFNKINQTLTYALMEDKISTIPYKEFLNYTQFFMPFETILSPNHNEAIVTCTKKINAKKQELLKKYAKEIEEVNVPALEKMEKELLDYAKEILKDNPALDLYDSGAAGTFGNNFKNMYVIKGLIKDPDPNATKQFNFVTSNRLDGIDKSEYSTIANSLAAGPYSRGKKTEKGGYWEKLFGAAFQSIYIDPPGSDCGTKKYLNILLTEDNYRQFMYNYIIKSNGELEELTSDNINKYINKKVKMRFSIFCKSKTGYCHHCAGNFFYRRSPDNRNVGLSLIQVCSKLKNLAMSAFHDSTVNTVEIDPMKAFDLKTPYSNK